MAIDKDTKEAIVADYREMLGRSQAVILAEYRVMPMGVLNKLRNELRNAGGGLRAGKNTLARIALSEAGLGVPTDMLKGSTIIGFCYNDVSAVAKIMLDFARDNADKFSVKGGVMGQSILRLDDVKALAELPPLPIVRGMLVGVLQAPAARLVGVLSAPGRQVATVLKAYADKENAPAEAAA